MISQEIAGGALRAWKPLLEAWCKYLGEAYLLGIAFSKVAKNAFLVFFFNSKFNSTMA